MLSILLALLALLTPAPDVTVAPCDMHPVPAFTSTAHCIAADGSIR